MRVGVYAHEYESSIGGSYTFVDTVVQAFLEEAASTRHEFVLFCTRQAKEALSDMITTRNIRLCVIPKRSLPHSFASNLKRFFPVVGSILQRFNLLERYAAREKVELVWFVGGWFYDTIDIPYVTTVWDVQHRTHPWFPEVASGGDWDYREQGFSSFLKRATRVITGTHIGKEQLSRYYQLPPEQVSVIPHPVPEFNGTAVTRPLGHLFACIEFSRKPYFLYPAQFWAHKNHVNLLLAMKVLVEKYRKDVNIVFTGSDKGNLDYVKSTAARLGIMANVFFLGFVSREQLFNLYKNALALAYVPFSGPENLPPLEALSLGCPVIISDYPGAREQIGEAALYVDPHDPENMASELNRFMEDGEIKNALTNKGRAQLEGKEATRYIRDVFKIFDEFQSIRRAWA